MNNFDIDAISQYISKVPTDIIIIILALETLRNVIAWLGIVPKGKKYSWLIYRSYSSLIVEDTLTALGFTNQKQKEILNTITYLGDSNVIKGAAKELVLLLSNYTRETTLELTYGKNTPVNTKYYINTMEASQNPLHLDIMCKIMMSLINKDNSIHKRPDFIITPKIGNPVFGHKFAEMNRMICLLRKGGSDKSRAQFDHTADITTSAVDNLRVNYEGFQYLLNKSNELQVGNKPLYGVIIDCNASGGSEILETIQEFNKLIEQTHLKIERIQYAYILFRPDVHADADKSFHENGYFLKRYFDLDEDTKKLLIDIKTPKTNLTKRKSKKNAIEIMDILKELYDKHYIKTPDIF